MEVVTFQPFQVIPTNKPDSLIRKCFAPSKLIFSSAQFTCRAVLMNLRDNFYYITTTVVKKKSGNTTSIRKNVYNGSIYNIVYYVFKYSI